MWARKPSGLSKQSASDLFLICFLNTDTVLHTEVVRELLSRGLFTHLLGVNNWKLSDNVVSTIGDVSKLTVWIFTLCSWIQDLSMSLHPVWDVLQSTYHTFISTSSYETLFCICVTTWHLCGFCSLLLAVCVCVWQEASTMTLELASHEQEVWESEQGAGSPKWKCGHHWAFCTICSPSRDPPPSCTSTYMQPDVHTLAHGGIYKEAYCDCQWFAMAQ